MRVVIDVAAYYDQEPIPPHVTVTPADLAEGRVKPNLRTGGMTMRVVRKRPSQVTISVSERDVVQKLLHAVTPQHGSSKITRREAVARLIVENVLPEHAHPSHVLGLHVDDDGPDQATFDREILPHVGLSHGRTRQVYVTEADLETMRRNYMESTSVADLVDCIAAKLAIKVET